MPNEAAEILAILDRCCDSFTFPMLDNGYVYLAATRLSLFRSDADWALVIEVFGFSPRSGLPDTQIHTFASRLHERNSLEKYASGAAHRNYLSAHPHDESRFVFPVDDGEWQDAEDGELVAETAATIRVRGQAVRLPTAAELTARGLKVQEPPRVHVFELCRYLADLARDEVLASPTERRVSVRPEMQQLIQLEEWRHPDLLGGERPSGSHAFRQIAKVLETGDVSNYRPQSAPSTHWSHWPEGGSL